MKKQTKNPLIRVFLCLLLNNCCFICWVIILVLLLHQVKKLKQQNYENVI